MRSRVTLLIALAALLATAPTAAAQSFPPPSLSVDSFGESLTGIVSTHFLPPNTVSTIQDNPAAVALDGDRIYTVGATGGTASGRDIGIVARRADGALDSGFSSDGKLTISLGTRADFGTGMVVLPDGRLRVVAATDVNGTGNENLDVAIVGVNRDGSPDAAFGALAGSGPARTGRFVFPVGPNNDTPTGIEVGPDGRFAIVGGRSDGTRDDVFVSLRQANGEPVTDFDGDGVMSRTTTSVVDSAVDVAFRPGGGLVVLSSVDPTTAANDATAVLHGFTDAGTDDARFAGGGDLTVAVGQPDTFPGGLIVHDGRLWVAGSTRVQSDVDAFIARVEADGTGLQSRHFDMRGRLDPAIQPVHSRAFDLAVVPGIPGTLVAVGSSAYAVSGVTTTDWAAAAFNSFDGDLARAGFGDIVLQPPGNFGLVAAAADSRGGLAVAGTFTNSDTGEDFGNVRLLIDAEKTCDLAVAAGEPGEIVFRGSSAATLTVRVQNVGTRACGGTLTVPGPYGMAAIATGLVLPGGTFTAPAVPVTYHGPRRADDVLLIDLSAADANTDNNRAAVHVVFSYCDLSVAPAGAAGAIPTEGKRRFELSLRNLGTATCRVAVGSKAPYPLARGKSASDVVSVAAPAGARPGARVPVVLWASAADDVALGNNAVTVSPTVVRVGDSDLTSWGSRRFAGTARRGAGDVPTGRLRPARVDVAILRESGRRCSWLSSTRGTFTGGRCGRHQWLGADGTTSWRLTLRKSLAPGRYVVFSRTTIRAGFREATFTAKDGNRVEFTVR